MHRRATRIQVTACAQPHGRSSGMAGKPTDHQKMTVQISKMIIMIISVPILTHTDYSEISVP